MHKMAQQSAAPGLSHSNAADVQPMPAFSWLFDGLHRGLRYYGVCVQGMIVVQVNGFVGSDYMSESRDVVNATPAIACAFVNELLSARDAKQARKVRRSA